MKSYTAKVRKHNERIAAKKNHLPHIIAREQKGKAEQFKKAAREDPMAALKALRGATHEHQYNRPAPAPLPEEARGLPSSPKVLSDNSAGLKDGRGMPLQAKANPASPKPSEPKERRLLIDGAAPPPPVNWQDKNRKRVTAHSRYEAAKTTFPRPVSKYYTGLNGFKKFLAYWNALDTDQHSRLNVHMYRKFPVIDRVLTGNKNSSIAVFTEKDDHDNGAKCPFEKENPTLSLLHMFGSGSYKFMLTERGVPNAIITCEVAVEDPSYPPVLDLRELQYSHPLNQSYIDGLRRRNVPLPWDKKENTEEEDDMADSKVVGELTGTVNRLVDRLGNQPSAPSVDAEAIGKGMAIVQNGASMAMDIVRAGISSQQVQSNPIEMLRAVAELTGAKKGDDAVTVQLMKSNSDLQQRMSEMQAESSRELRALMLQFFEAQKASAAAIPAPKSELEVLQEAVQKQKLLEELHGGNGRKRKNDDEEDEKKESTAEMLVKNLPMIAAAVTALAGIAGKAIDGYIAIRTGVPPPNMQPQMQPQYRPQQPQQQQPMQEPIRQPEGFGIAQPQPQPAEQQQPQIPAEIDLANFAAATEDDQMTILQLLPLIKTMEPAFLAHYYGEDTSGDTFAHWVITSGTGANPTQEGRATYDALKELGTEKLIGYLKMYEPIWSRIGKLPTKTAEFLHNFMSYDELQKGEVEDEKS